MSETSELGNIDHEAENIAEIPKGSGYERKIEDYAKNRNTEKLAGYLRKFYPAFLKYIEKHQSEKSLGRRKEEVLKKLEEGDSTIIQTLAVCLEEELGSRDYRQNQILEVGKKGDRHRDPRTPERTIRILNTRDFVNAEAGEQMVEVANIVNSLGRDEKALAAAKYHDWGMALGKSKSSDRGKLLMFPEKKATPALPKVASGR